MSNRFNRKTKQPVEVAKIPTTAEILVAQRAQLELLEQWERVEAQLKRLGHEVTQQTRIVDLYRIVSDCLEQLPSRSDSNVTDERK